MSISALANTDVHRITSGQVIIDLTSAVKELIENSIDANASRIEIVIKNYGIDSIEVIDDGDGINSEDYDKICLKHYTSKLSSFEDILTVSTLGFRGEAMSSLCSISNVKVTTATAAESPKATVLIFNKMGLVAARNVVPGVKGTTIQITDLFESLPVRRKDFIKNSKREFQKALSFIQNYALISLGIRFTVYSVSPKGKKSLILGTQGTSLKGNLLSVFGSNGMHGLIPIDINLEFNAKSHLMNEMSSIRFKGFVSNSSFGMGRSASDRQMFFINKRPVNLRHFAKIINEVYKTFNYIQYPVIFLDLEVDSNNIDINVTPDKRTVLIHNENIILDYLREKLVEFFNEQNNTVPKNNQSQPAKNDGSFLDVFNITSISADSHIPQRDGDVSGEETHENIVEDVNDEEAHVSDNEPGLENMEPEEDIEDVIDSPPKKARLYSQIEVPEIFNQEESDINETNEDNEDEEHEESNSSLNSTDSLKKYKKSPEVYDSFLKSSASSQPLTISIGDQITEELPTKRSKTRVVFEDEKPCCIHSHPKSPTPLLEDEMDEAADDSNMFVDLSDGEELEPIASQQPAGNLLDENEFSALGSSQIRARKLDSGLHDMEGFLNTKISHISDSLQELLSSEILDKGYEGSNVSLVKKQVEDIYEAEKAEAKLTLSVSKNDFLDMKIVGQFNLGFIIVTRLQRNSEDIDLFIVDQHASDEKYNFENLQKDTVFESQPLVIPQPVELNTMDELTVLDNLNIFEKNGFKLEVDEEEYPGQRIKLVSLPLSKSTTFDISDFNELIHLIKENDGSKKMVRCSKIRSMFAMRACRKSIMIGKSLTKKTMTGIVRNLSELDKPWNCPHGRPTMRHLMELNDWKNFSDDYVL